MGEYTEKLQLYKANTATDGNDTFNIDKMLNDNWDKIEDAMSEDKSEFNFDNPVSKADMEYSYTEDSDTGVITEYWKLKADGSVYATRTNTPNEDETQWTITTVCDSKGVNITEVWTEQDDETWKGEVSANGDATV